MTPETAGPYHAAYIIVGAAYAAYALSIWLRARKVRSRSRGE